MSFIQNTALNRHIQIIKTAFTPFVTHNTTLVEALPKLFKLLILNPASLLKYTFFPILNEEM